MFLKSDEARLYKLSECVHFGASTADDFTVIIGTNLMKLGSKLSREVRRKTRIISQRRNMCCDQHGIILVLNILNDEDCHEIQDELSLA